VYLFEVRIFLENTGCNWTLKMLLSVVFDNEGIELRRVALYLEVPSTHRFPTVFEFIYQLKVIWKHIKLISA
jgi:hypothetical protein